MNIQSAQITRDEEGNQTGIQIIYLDSNEQEQVCTVPIDGTTWQNHQLNDWVAAGGKIG